MQFCMSEKQSREGNCFSGCIHPFVALELGEWRSVMLLEAEGRGEGVGAFTHPSSVFPGQQVCSLSAKTPNR